MEQQFEINPVEALNAAVDTIVVARLMHRLQMIEQENNPENIEEYDAINHVLSFFLDVDTLVEFSTRDIPTEWLDTVVESANA